ncbi:MAG: N-acetyl-gamma-glutamyl-phosphate reductase [Desulfobacteraceae bacterium]|jgi:N-acetyl-gamma-glutamyl-phosphate reductase|nr:N-acetyl-gamma-glutamyl-phosphate reductase [Desulfobacteraceae bacterium]
MSINIFIDGHVGTTGLRIHDWLSIRHDIEVIALPEKLRKNTEARREMVLSSDIAILCLPDDAAIEVANWAKDENTRLIDASTAHRVAEDWVYGLPELQPNQRDLIRNAKFVSNTGCHAAAFILLIRPLVDENILMKDSPITVRSLSGYSGGGRPMINKWEDPEKNLKSLPYEAPYALQSVHKHIPEMMKYSGLTKEPQFTPAVGPFRCGMRVQVPIHSAILKEGSNGKDVWQALEERYRNDRFVDVLPLESMASASETAYDPRSCNDTNSIKLCVIPHPSGHVTLMAILDNLGKGASGMAIQNLNLMLGIQESEGLPK